MDYKSLFSVRNIIIAITTLVLIAATCGLILFFIDKKKKSARF